MMNASELEALVCEKLNADRKLAAAGCKAYSSDAQDFARETETQLQQSDGLAIVVAAGAGERGGANTDDGVPVVHAAFRAAVGEKVAVNRARANHMTAQQAALRVIALLDCPQFLYLSHAVEVDDRNDVVIFAVTFRTVSFVPPTP